MAARSASKGPRAIARYPAPALHSTNLASSIIQDA